MARTSKKAAVFSTKAKGVAVESIEIPIADLAKLTGYTTRGLEVLITDGRFKKSSPGKVMMLEAVRAVCDHLREARRTKSNNPSAQQLTELKIEELKIRLKEKNRELIPFDDAAQALNMFNYICLQEYLMLPAMIANKNLKERERVEAIIDEGRARVRTKLAALKAGRCSQAARVRADNFAYSNSLATDDDGEIE